MKSWTVWTRSGLGPDQYRQSQVVPVPVPEFLSGTRLSSLRSSKNGLGPDQTKFPNTTVAATVSECSNNSITSWKSGQVDGQEDEQKRIGNEDGLLTDGQ